MSKEKTIKLGNLDSIRDFSFVSDQCNNLLYLASINTMNGEVFNLGSNIGISIHDLYLKIAKLTNTNNKIIIDKQRLRPINSEVSKLICDNTKFFKLSGLKNKIKLEDGLLKTIKWYSNKNNLEKYKFNIYNI